METKIISTEAASILKENQNKGSSESTSAIKFTSSIKAVFYSFLIGVILVFLTSHFADSTQEYSVWTLFEQIYMLNFGNSTAATEMLARMSYLVPLGLSLVVSFRMGIFNIGASGQSFLGGVFAFFVATRIDLGNFGFIITIISGVTIGMLMAFIIAFLKNKFNINEVITSIMLNWIAFYIVNQFGRQLNHTDMSLIDQNDLRFDFINNIFSIFGPASKRVNLGVLLILPLPIIIAFMYSKTKWGFKQDLIGNNPNTGKYVGINSKKEIYKTMLLSGALAGLAGTIYLVGFDNSLSGFGSQFTDIPGATFDGIAIALVGYNSPLGVILSSTLFAILKVPDLDVQIGTFHIVDIIMGLMVIFIAMSALRVKYGKKGGGK